MSKDYNSYKMGLYMRKTQFLQSSQDEIKLASEIVTGGDTPTFNRIVKSINDNEENILLIGESSFTCRDSLSYKIYLNFPRVSFLSEGGYFPFLYIKAEGKDDYRVGEMISKLDEGQTSRLKHILSYVLRESRISISKTSEGFEIVVNMHSKITHCDVSAATVLLRCIAVKPHVLDDVPSKSKVVEWLTTNINELDKIFAEWNADAFERFGLASLAVYIASRDIFPDGLRLHHFYTGVIDYLKTKPANQYKAYVEKAEEYLPRNLSGNLRKIMTS